MNLDSIFNHLDNFEKKGLKNLLLLSPCFYLLMYLFFSSFCELPIFTQCVFTVATTILMYSFVSMAVLALAIAENLFERLHSRILRINILLIIVSILVGFIWGFYIFILVRIGIVFFATFVAHFIYLVIYCTYKGANKK